MAKKYSYSAEDQSILSPILYKFFVNPLVAILPYRVPANFITFSSFLCIITMSEGTGTGGLFQYLH